MDCALVRNHLDAYVDGELEPSPSATLETHLHTCPVCRDELVMSRALKRAVHGLPRPAVSESMRANVIRALDQAERGESGSRRSIAFTAGLAVAAAALLAVVALKRPEPPPVASAEPPSAIGMPAQQVRFGFGDITGEVVDSFAKQPPPDLQPNPDRVSSWLSSTLGFRVRPVEFAQADVRLAGVGVTKVGPHPAALLNYTVGNSRMSVVVFQASGETQRVLHENDEAVARSGGRRVRVGSHMVTYRNDSGYTVPVLEHGGLAYAFVGDLDEQSLLKLIGAARLP
jgi:anti-sigma factor RsiW